VLGFGAGVDLGWAYDNYLALLTASLICSVVLAAALYGASFRPAAGLASGGTSGWPHYDFWMGRELNPRLWALDLKARM
jgi:delta14-sterol reductase